MTGKRTVEIAPHAGFCFGVKRAVEALSEILTEDELKGVKRVLTAAALTYVAALATSLANLLRLIFIVNGRNRD